MNFRVDLEVFRGPLDLLLYLVRKHEVEIVDIPVAPITDQFLAYLAVLEEFDVNRVGDFIEMASTLIEIKSRMVLPRGDEVQGEIDDPRQQLVERLLEYKKFKDAATMLEERSRSWQQRLPRLSNDLPPRRTNLAEQPLRELELWDLVSAFGRVVRDNAASRPSNIVYDETPIHVYMRRILARLARDGRVSFGDLFTPDMHKSTQVGIFLAMLELVSHHHIRAEQNTLFGEIWVLPGANFDGPLVAAGADHYQLDAAE